MCFIPPAKISSNVEHILNSFHHPSSASAHKLETMVAVGEWISRYCGPTVTRGSHLPVLMIGCDRHHELISSLDAVAKWAILEFDSGYSIPFATDVESRAYGYFISKRPDCGLFKSRCSAPIIFPFSGITGLSPRTIDICYGPGGLVDVDTKVPAFKNKFSCTLVRSLTQKCPGQKINFVPVKITMSGKCLNSFYIISYCQE